MWRWTGSVVIAAALGAACGGGGGGGGKATATPTRTLAPPATPTRTAPPAAEVSIGRVFPAIGGVDGGEALLVEGAGFAAAGANLVTVGDVAATNVLTLNDRQLSCVVPPGMGGSVVAVSVSNDRGSATLSDAFRYGGGDSPDALFLEVLSEPAVSFDDAIGTTTVVLDYLVRDDEGVPLEEDDIEVAMFVDGEQLGTGRFGESILDRDSTELDLSVSVTLVLDASFSLQQFDPPQFSPMLNGAQRLVDSGTDLWRDRGGLFDWQVLWFDELISTPAPDADRFRIRDIPEPQPGSFTKLYAAISAALERSAARYGDGIAAGERDRHVLVVFTDGLDNLSSFANPDVRQQGELRNGDPYPRFGWRATDLDNVLSQIADHPAYPTNLTVHSIALGQDCSEASAGDACFDGDALADIAQVGLGQQLTSPRSAADLFDLIQREFTTLQSSGAVMALPPGNYEFRLVARERRNRRAEGEIRFRFAVRSDGAGFVSF
jgi:hypothetical protein